MHIEMKARGRAGVEGRLAKDRVVFVTFFVTFASLVVILLRMTSRSSFHPLPLLLHRIQRHLAQHLPPLRERPFHRVEPLRELLVRAPERRLRLDPELPS